MRSPPWFRRAQRRNSHLRPESAFLGVVIIELRLNDPEDESADAFGRTQAIAKPYAPVIVILGVVAVRTRSIQ